MRTVNHWYAHSEALRQYVRIPIFPPPPIWGYLQHGYNIETGVPYRNMVSALPKLVWNSHNAAMASEAGLRNVVPIGAPFLYLLEVLGLRAVLPPILTTEEEATLVYLTHSGFENPALGDHARYAAAIRDREAGRVRVSVHWMDRNRQDLLKPYEASGFELLFSPHRSDPFYMRTQLGRLLSARRVVADQVGTGLLYAAALGREVEIYGDVFTHAKRPGWAKEIQDFSRHHVSEVLDGPVSGEQARQVAYRELGASHVRPPDELARIVGWSGFRWRFRNQARYAALTRRRLIKLWRRGPTRVALS